MRLSRPTIIAEIQASTLVFTPEVDDEQIGTSSVDLRLGNTFIYLEEELEAERAVGADVRWHVNSPWKPFADKYGRPEFIPDGQALELSPNKLVLGYTLEFMKLPPNLAGRVEGKSGPARRGLLIHLTAPTIQAGWHGQIQLELYNVGPATLLLPTGIPICQLILEQVTEPEQYEGQFQSQVS